MEARDFPPEKKSAQPAPLWKRILRTALTTVAVIFGIGIPLLMIFEDKLIYFPTKDGVGASPGEEVWLTAADGVKVHGWYLPHPKARATILHLHGNAGNLEDRRDLVCRMKELGVNVMAIDFRGYGKSEGSPNESGVCADSRAAYDWLLTKSTADRIVIHGESLGGGPACELAANVPCGGLIVQSAFTSARDMAPRVLPWFPRFLVRTRFDNLEKVARIACRKLFLHSRRDEIVPFEMGERLFAAASAPKECEWFATAGHNDLSISHPKKYYSRLEQFLEPFGK
ncbi:MAG: alpha/beta hydrolase [Planctomycetes bacterium]|nr:alpha/beta hydrolase [Planctomycetota bacterium]